MNFKHACFISYRNGDREDNGLNARRNDIRDTINAFALDLRDELKFALNTRISPDDCLVFLDQDTKCIKEGDPLMKKLAAGVCQSVCMVVVFTGHYLDKEKLICAAELEGMIRRLKSRCAHLGIDPSNAVDNIFTAVFREAYRVPDILNENLRFDFTGYADSSVPLRDNPEFKERIRIMAEQIADFWEEIRENEDDSLNIDCKGFKLLDPKKNQNELLDFVNKHRKPFIRQSARS